MSTAKTTRTEATLWLEADTYTSAHPTSARAIINVGSALTIYSDSPDALRALARACFDSAERLDRKEAHGEICETDPCGDCQRDEAEGRAHNTPEVPRE